MRKKSKNQLANLLDEFGQIGDGECRAYLAVELYRIAEGTEFAPADVASHRDKAKKMMNRCSRYLLDKGLWVVPIRADAVKVSATGSRRFYSSLIGLNKAQKSLETVEPDVGTEYVAGQGRPIRGYVIGRGPATWPVAKLLRDSSMDIKRRARRIRAAQQLESINALPKPAGTYLELDDRDEPQT